MKLEHIRGEVLAAIASVAPEASLPALQPDRPLRDQIDLDSLDWLNVAAAVQERLRLAIPESELDRLATLDQWVAFLAGAHALPRATSPGQPAARHLRLDETEITLRTIRREDAAMEAEFVQQLSEQSRYLRFMGMVRELPADKLRELTDVDGVHHVALVATTLRDGRERQLGVARYIVDASGRACEFAIVVADAWQRSGLAGVLMQALIDIARSRGLQRMESSVLATNLPMLHFARQLGFEVQPDPGDATTRRVTRRL